MNESTNDYEFIARCQQAIKKGDLIDPSIIKTGLSEEEIEVLRKSGVANFDRLGELVAIDPSAGDAKKYANIGELHLEQTISKLATKIKTFIETQPPSK